MITIDKNSLKVNVLVSGIAILHHRWIFSSCSSLLFLLLELELHNYQGQRNGSPLQITITLLLEKIFFVSSPNRIHLGIIFLIYSHKNKNKVDSFIKCFVVQVFQGNGIQVLNMELILWSNKKFDVDFVNKIWYFGSFCPPCGWVVRHPFGQPGWQGVIVALCDLMGTLKKTHPSPCSSQLSLSSHRVYTNEVSFTLNLWKKTI